MNEKRNTLILSILLFWFASIIYFNPRLFALLIGDEPYFAKISVLLFIITLDFLWLYGIYHLVHIFFSYLITKKNNFNFSNNWYDSSLTPHVAVLYMTMNDFDEKACETCLNQNYKNYKLFICDDSDNSTIKDSIKSFINVHSENIGYFEREKRIGFKAGNINNALRHLDAKYEYVLITDADSELPSNFISKIMPYFYDDKIAFVQAMQKSINHFSTEFSKDLSPLINMHYSHYVINKNEFGHCMWFGHGAILKRSIIEKVGGIPEIVTEDLAFSSEIRRFGYYGIVADDVISYEAIPQNILTFRKRNRKWVRGTFEYFIKYFPKLLFSKNVPWFEKMDILISGFSLLQAIPFLLFIFIASFIMPLFYTVHHIKGPFFLIPPIIYDSWYGLILNTRYNVFWSLDFYLIMIITIFPPLIPVLIDMRIEKIKMIKFLCLETFINLSLLFDSAKEIICYLFSGNTFFYVTGDVNHSKEKPVFLIFEIIIGLFLSYHAIKTYNLWLISLSIAMLITPFWFFLKNNKLLKMLSAIPFFMTSIISILIGITIFQKALIS